jgi:methyltransferase
MDMISFPALAFIGVVILQRLGELVLARRNTQRLIARGGYEVAGEHYPAIVALHAAWIMALVSFGWAAPVSPGWLAVYVVLQAFRVWILASLGARWTTRIIIIDEPLVRRGPYKFLPHPNYLLVVAELITVPMVLGLFWVAVVFTALNALVLAIRISAENKALAAIKATSA